MANQRLESTPTMIGTLSEDKVIVGTLCKSESLVSTLSKDKELIAILSTRIENQYNGSYVFTPSKEDQTIDTDYRLLTQDLTIKGIPYYEVSNEHGITIIIGDY